MTKKKKVAKKETKIAKAAPEKSFDFDLAKFESAQFKERTKEIPVVNADLALFFPKGTKPMLLCRGLTAQELAQADHFVQMNKEARTENLLTNMGTEAIDALRKLLRVHLGDDVPDLHVKMLHMVHMGLVKPQMTYEQVIKFSQAFPGEFRALYVEVSNLTGRGQDLMGKQQDSGQTLESSTA